MLKRDRIQYTMLFAVDAVSLLLSTLTAWLLLGPCLRLILEYPASDWLQFYAMLIIAFLAVFFGFAHADSLTQRAWKAELLTCAQLNIMLAAALAVLLLLTKALLLDSRYMYVGIPLANILVQFALRSLLKRYLNKSFYKGSQAILVGVVTTRQRADQLVHDLKDDWTKRIQGVVLIDGGPDDKEADGIPVVAVGPDFMQWVRRDPLDEIYLCVPYHDAASIQGYIEEMESMGITIHLNVPTLEPYLAAHHTEKWMPKLQHTLETCGNVPFVAITSTRQDFTALLIKRAMDIACALVGLLISIPIILITAIPLKLESPGPLLFKQQRVGLNGRVFYIYKVRSMYQDAEERKKELMDKNKMEGFMFKVDDDPRITKVGRFIRRTSIDELPQFWNVLRGDMSLVGTRPPTMDEYVHYKSHHKRRLSMKPGITGLWQVSGRSDIHNFEEVVKLDVTYIDNWSLKLDIKILLKTVAVVFGRRGAE